MCWILKSGIIKLLELRYFASWIIGIFAELFYEFQPGKCIVKDTESTNLVYKYSDNSTFTLRMQFKSDDSSENKLRRKTKYYVKNYALNETAKLLKYIYIQILLFQTEWVFENLKFVINMERKTRWTYERHVKKVDLV